MSESRREPGRTGLQILVYLYRRSPRGTEYLLLKRLPERHGFWQGVTGRVEPGEGLPEAAARELAEETGARTPVALRAMGWSHVFELRPEFRSYYPGCTRVEEHLFAAEAPPGFVPALQPAEHSESRWCTLEEAEVLLRWPTNVKALHLVEEAIH